MEDRHERMRRLARERKTKQRIKERRNQTTAKSGLDFVDIQQESESRTDEKSHSCTEIAPIQTADSRQSLAEEAELKLEVERIIKRGQNEILQAGEAFLTNVGDLTKERESENQRTEGCIFEFINVEQGNENQTDDETLIRREIARLRTAERRQRLSQEELDTMREKERRRIAAKRIRERHQETQQEKEARMEIDRKRSAQRLQNETPEERNRRITNVRIRTAERRKNLSQTELVAKREIQRLRVAERRRNETAEEKMARREKDRMRLALRKQNESADEAQERRLKDRDRYRALITKENEDHFENTIEKMQIL